MSKTTTMADTNATLSDNDEFPPLKLEVLKERIDKLDAVNLVADSVAQQRQAASSALIFHHYCLSLLALALAAMHTAMYARVGGFSGQKLYAAAEYDASAMVIVTVGVVFCYLMTVRYFTTPYITAAEEVKWLEWLHGPDGKEDVIIGARFGKDIIGTVVLRLLPSPKKSKAPSRADIRAWTTMKKYRKLGMGGDMLREAVVVAQDLLGRNVVVGFAEDHANSQRVLYDTFSGFLDEREVLAKRVLKSAIETPGARAKELDCRQ